MTTILVRKAGNYEITYEPGRHVYCNGIPTTVRDLDAPILANGRTVVALVDTKCLGKNGKVDVVSLTSEELALIRGPKPEIRTVSKSAERRHDDLYNEGGEGYNPHRSGAAPTDRRR